MIISLRILTEIKKKRDSDKCYRENENTLLTSNIFTKIAFLQYNYEKYGRVRQATNIT
jgi:hypothetical protein